MFMGHLVLFQVFNSTLDVEESFTDKGNTTHYVTFSALRIELRKKRNQTPCKEGVFDFFDTQQLLPQIAMIITTVMLFFVFSTLYYLLACLSLTQYYCSFLPKAQLNTECKTKPTMFTGRLVSICVFDSYLDFEISHIISDQVGIC